MNIQIFGSKKCFDTGKAERYFKERSIKYQYIDLWQKGISKGELASVSAAVGIENLINSSSKEYKTLNVGSIRSREIKEELILNNPKLLKTPIVKNGRQATIGYQPEVWKSWE